MSRFNTLGRMSAIAAATVLVAATASPAFATDPTSGTAPRAQQEKRICVSDTVTGSRMARKVCKTREQWLREDGVDPSATAPAR